MDAIVASIPRAQPLVTLVNALQDHSTTLEIVAAIVLILVAIFAGTLLWRIVRLTGQIEAADDEADREGERASARADEAHPLTNYSRFGTASDPLNIKVVAHADQLVTAFNAAGWYRADRIRVFSSLRLSIATVFHLKYPQAPVSNLYLYGRKQDFAFQKPGRSVRERDHVRFWDSGERARRRGSIVWVGAATRDSDVALSPRTRLITHKIEPDVDAERATIVRDLMATGWVVSQKWEAGFGRPVELVNAMGHPFYTDGRVAVLTLAHAPVLLPLATRMHGPRIGALNRRVAAAFRWMLPKVGRRMAEEQAGEPPVTARRRPPAEA